VLEELEDAELSTICTTEPCTLEKRSWSVISELVGGRRSTRPTCNASGASPVLSIVAVFGEGIVMEGLGGTRTVGIEKPFIK
jgi:hypothetical protein